MRAARRLWLAALVLAMVAATAGVASATSAEDVPVTSISTGEATGQSTLGRSADGIRARITTGDLAAGHAYTVWAVVFNTPNACEGPCDAGDLNDPSVGAASLLGGGGVARTTTTTFAVALPASDDLTNPMGAEVHFVVRTHGPAIPGLVGEQTSTLNGGCPPNACANEFVALHKP